MVPEGDQTNPLIGNKNPGGNIGGPDTPFAPPTPLRSPPQTPPQWASFALFAGFIATMTGVRLLVSVHHRL